MQSYNFNRNKKRKINFKFPNLKVWGVRTKNFSTRTSSSNSSTSNTQDYYVRIIIRSFVYYLVIALASFFIFIGIFANINNLWGFFRPQVKYEEKQFGPSKPYLSIENDYTKESTINLSGTAESSKKVTLFKNGEYSEETIADSSNKFEFASVPIKAENDSITKFYVVVEDGHGGKSPQSNLILVTYDDKKPILSVSDPISDQRIKDYSRSYEVKGKTEKDAKVTINEKLGRVSPEGDFSVNVALKDEVNILKVVATDKAGNESVIEVPVYFEKRN